MAQKIDPNTPTTSGSTENYGLPQWSGNDLTDWFELNSAFSKIDEVMKSNADAVETAKQTADSNTGSIANLTQSLNNTIQNLAEQTNVNVQQNQQITLNTTHLNEHDTSIQNLKQQVNALTDESTGTVGDVSALQADVTELQGKITTAQQDIATNTDHIGNLTGLETTAKGNLVAAINEIIGGSGSGEETTLADIGNLSQLSTSAKENLVAAINEVNEKASDVPQLTPALYLYTLTGKIFSVSSQNHYIFLTDENEWLKENNFPIVSIATMANVIDLKPKYYVGLYTSFDTTLQSNLLQINNSPFTGNNRDGNIEIKLLTTLEIPQNKLNISWGSLSNPQPVTDFSMILTKTIH